MSFSRHPEIYQSDGWVGGPGLLPLARPPHRLDEFPASYSLAGCSPAEPASASPTDASMNESVRRDKHSSANGNVSLVLLSQPWGPLQSVPVRITMWSVNIPYSGAHLLRPTACRAFRFKSEAVIVCLN